MSLEPRPLTQEELHRHAPWLHRLAVRLVGSGHADDVVQETWLQALHHPPEPDLKPWLSGVMRNLWRMRRRADERRRVREREAAHLVEPAPSQETAAHAAATLALLERLVAALPEPYRATVRLRYHDGLSAAEIARRLGIPAGTVRWRLQEALAQLQRALDEQPGGRRAWCLALAPLAKSLPHASPSKSPSPARRRTWLMHGAWVSALVLLLVSLWPRQDQSTPSRPHALFLPPSRSAPLPSWRHARPFAPADACNCAVSGRVRSRYDAVPVGGAIVELARDGAIYAARSDEDGRFTLRLPRPGRYRLVGVSAHGYDRFGDDEDEGLTIDARRDEPLGGVDFPLVPVRDLDCTITGDGHVLGDVEMRRFHAGSGNGAALPVRISDGDGRVEVSAGRGDLLVFAHPGFAPAKALVDDRAWETRRLVVQLMPGEQATHAIAGRVLDGAGDAVAGARVSAWLQPADAQMEPMPATTTLRDGRFSIGGLPAGDYVVRAEVHGLVPAWQRTRAGAAPVTLRLAGGGVIRGSVRSDDGKPIAPLLVHAMSSDGERRWLDGYYAETVVAPDGRYELAGIAPGHYQVWIQAAQRPLSTPRDVDVGLAVPARADFTLAAGVVLHGRVVDGSDGTPIAGARLELTGSAVDPIVRTDGEGNFAIGGFGSVPRAVDVRAAGHHGFRVGPLAADDARAPRTIALPASAPTAPSASSAPASASRSCRAATASSRSRASCRRAAAPSPASSAATSSKPSTACPRAATPAAPSCSAATRARTCTCASAAATPSSTWWRNERIRE